VLDGAFSSFTQSKNIALKMPSRHTICTELVEEGPLAVQYNVYKEESDATILLIPSCPLPRWES
jgi:hypothetical protein